MIAPIEISSDVFDTIINFTPSKFNVKMGIINVFQVYQ